MVGGTTWKQWTRDRIQERVSRTRRQGVTSVDSDIYGDAMRPAVKLAILDDPMVLKFRILTGYGELISVDSLTRTTLPSIVMGLPSYRELSVPT